MKIDCYQRFVSNKLASMWIPLRLLISIVLISFITGLALLGSQLVSDTVSHDKLLTDLYEIKQSLETLYQHGECRSIHEMSDNLGSKQVFSLTIPPSISSVFFGKKGNESNEFVSCIRCQIKKNTKIIYVDHEIRLIKGVFTNDQWQANENETGLLLKQGTCSFTAELVCNDNDQFILLY